MAALRLAVVLLLLGAVLAGLSFGAYVGGEVFFQALGQLDPAIAAAIVGSLGTIVASVVGVIWNQRSLQRRQIEEAHRPSKTAAYENFIENIVIKVLRQAKEGQIDEEELQELFYEFTGDVIVWASPDFIKAYESFRAAGQKADQRILVYLDDMLQAVRKDLGHSDRLHLKRGDLIKLFLTDPENIDKVVESGGE